MNEAPGIEMYFPVAGILGEEPVWMPVMAHSLATLLPEMIRVFIVILASGLKFKVSLK